MVDVDQEANAEEMNASGSSRGGGVEQGGVGWAFVVEKEAFGGDVRDIERAVAHFEGGFGCLGLSGDVIAWDNEGKAVGQLSKVVVSAVTVEDLQGVGEGTGFGASVGIDGGAGGDVDVLLTVFAAETDGLQVAVGGGGGKDGCHFFGIFLG